MQIIRTHAIWERIICYQWILSVVWVVSDFPLLWSLLFNYKLVLLQFHHYQLGLLRAISLTLYSIIMHICILGVSNLLRIRLWNIFWLWLEMIHLYAYCKTCVCITLKTYLYGDTSLVTFYILPVNLCNINSQEKKHFLGYFYVCKALFYNILAY